MAARLARGKKDREGERAALFIEYLTPLDGAIALQKEKTYEQDHLSTKTADEAPYNRRPAGWTSSFIRA